VHFADNSYRLANFGAIGSGLIANLNLKLNLAPNLLYVQLATFTLSYMLSEWQSASYLHQNSCGATTLLATKQLANAVGGRTGGSICKLSFCLALLCQMTWWRVAGLRWLLVLLTLSDDAKTLIHLLVLLYWGIATIATALSPVKVQHLQAGQS